MHTFARILRTRTRVSRPRDATRLKVVPGVLHVLGPARQYIIGDNAAQRVGDDGDLAPVGFEVGVPLDEHLVQAIQFLLKPVP